MRGDGNEMSSAVVVEESVIISKKVTMYKAPERVQKIMEIPRKMRSYAEELEIKMELESIRKMIRKYKHFWVYHPKLDQFGVVKGVYKSTANYNGVKGDEFQFFVDAVDHKGRFVRETKWKVGLVELRGKAVRCKCTAA